MLPTDSARPQHIFAGEAHNLVYITVGQSLKNDL